MSDVPKAAGFTCQLTSEWRVQNSRHHHHLLSEQVFSHSMPRCPVTRGSTFSLQHTHFTQNKIICFLFSRPLCTWEYCVRL